MRPAALIECLGLYIGTLLAGLATIYGLVAWLAVRRPIGQVGHSNSLKPPVTILKPLYGAEPETYGCLLSFCDQQYPVFQIVFGVADASDPVVAIVKKLQRARPHLDIALSVDRRQHGGNRKVCNLVNMMALARHEVFVVADSDVRVGRDYLAKVVAPLSDHAVGIVTCTYRCSPRAGVCPLLGALFITDWFAPSVRVAALAGSRAFAFGATIALRRETLSFIGGFRSVANQLADDYCLGALTRRAGLRTVLSGVVVETVVPETTGKQLALRELRWLRTIRAINPHSYRFLFLTFSLPVAAIGTLLSAKSLLTVGMLVTTVVARLLVHFNTRASHASLALMLLLPLRDVLSFGLWTWSFVTRRVQWRDSNIRIANDGSVWIIEST